MPASFVISQGFFEDYGCVSLYKGLPKSYLWMFYDLGLKWLGLGLVFVRRAAERTPCKRWSWVRKPPGHMLTFLSVFSFLPSASHSPGAFLVDTLFQPML